MSIILIAEDQQSVRQGLCQALKEEGHSAVGVSDGEEALEYIQKSTVDILITDMRMPKLNGLDLLKAAKRINPETHVVVITAFGKVEEAVAAMKLGAYDYITKPFDIEEINFLIKKITERDRLVDESTYLKEEIRTHYNFKHIVGNSPAIKKIYDIMDKVAPSDSAVLIRGESGTGKELIAGAIHYKSPRRDRPFIRLSCAALPETLLESELFGHEKGSFTGALTRRKGRFELADGGTLFLDDIGDISLNMQVKLLRVLQEKEFERVGGTQTLKVDVRIIAATHRDLESSIKQNTFREDLYYRLNVICIQVPPLRERPEDIPLLANYFLKKFEKKTNRPGKAVDPDSVDKLLKYNWPGNVRELENVIERAVVLMGNDPVLLPHHLFLTAVEELPGKPRMVPLPEMPQEGGGSLKGRIKKWEKEQLIQILKEARWVQTKAAEILGIPRTSLRYKMKKLGIMEEEEGSLEEQNSKGGVNG